MSGAHIAAAPDRFSGIAFQATLVMNEAAFAGMSPFGEAYHLERIETEYAKLGEAIRAAREEASVGAEVAA
ncbi:hypothetical protein DYI37_03340 [Fulvimarina endophytica]|uniref:Uncharacterized protein n=1 Tax=Fulvimarina endophytica TaxID=2293836 RepID=A0A371XBA2_9HYPH|nr:hypothetical protein [Fulvimarina endophytica]RFC66490.1 hypothetical protein DYI37_03340 [Fulvimarina endophytica]